MKEEQMPKGPNGEKRPADVIGNAIMVGRIATGEMEDIPASKSGRVKSGIAGGNARAAALNQGERREIAMKAAKSRWNDERRRDMTNTNNACEQLAALYKKKASEGLIDAKYFVSNVGDVAKEIVFAEALRFDEAVERGDTTPLDFNDRHAR
jgi:hypothetical protein